MNRYDDDDDDDGDDDGDDDDDDIIYIKTHELEYAGIQNLAGHTNRDGLKQCGTTYGR